MLRSTKTKRVLLALAALRLRRDEIDDLVKFIAGTTPDELYRLLHQIERDISFSQVDEDDTARKQASFRHSTANEVVSRVISLLKNDAVLTTSEIIDGLTELLGKEKEVEILPRFIAKRSISEWLSAVTKVVGPSKLLQAATVLRNQQVHQEKSPWPLDKPK